MKMGQKMRRKTHINEMRYALGDDFHHPPWCRTACWWQHRGWKWACRAYPWRPLFMPPSSIKLKEEGEFSIDTPWDCQKVIFLHKAVGQLLSCPLGTLLELVDDGWTDETPTQSCPQSQDGVSKLRFRFLQSKPRCNHVNFIWEDE